MAKPDWPSKRRDGDRGRNRDRNVREPMRDNVVMHPASAKRPGGPRQDHAKPQVAKQGVKGALRAANLRLLLENAPVREALALVAEVPLERLEAMSQGALCPDETAFHIERTLRLPGKWLDGLNKAVPARTLELLKNPHRAEQHDDEDFEEGAPALPPVATLTSAQPASEGSADRQPAAAATQASAHASLAREADFAVTTALQSTPPAATSVDEADTAQGAADPATGAVQTLAVRESLQAAGARAATAPRRAAAAAEVQLPLSEIDPPSPSGLKEVSAMASPELRKQNLTVLLQGKGAKSALSRVLHAKPPYVSAMLSGRKNLDKELCNGMARALGLPDDWFEAPRTAADIPTATLQRLAPLGDAAANADTAASRSDTAEAAAAPTADSATSAAGTPAAAESTELGTALPGSAEGDATTPDAASQAAPVQQQRRHSQNAPQRGGQPPIEPTEPAAASTSVGITAAPQADPLGPVEAEAQGAAQAPAPALDAEVIARPAPVPVAAQVEALTPVDPRQSTLQAADFTPVYSQPLIIEGGLAPITEALIKLLLIKARQGALSEDKAFEWLGAVRLL